MTINNTTRLICSLILIVGIIISFSIEIAYNDWRSGKSFEYHGELDDWDFGESSSYLNITVSEKNK